jgi:prolyl-tRNA editing enzyme YbaK/EbsC (Cys-tRNA(Pro) deacylase)
MRKQAGDSKSISGFATVSKPIGGVAPIGWTSSPAITLIDQALNDYDVVWAAAGHPHTVFPTSFAELVRASGGNSAIVGD